MNVGDRVRGCFGEATIIAADLKVMIPGTGYVSTHSVIVRWDKESPVGWETTLRTKSLDWISGPIYVQPHALCPECEEEDYFFEEDYICAVCRMEIE